MTSFLFSFNVFAVENHPVNNLSYGNYLNLYNLQYDDREIAQRYFNFLKDNSLHDIIFGNINSYGCEYPKPCLEKYMYDLDYFISLFGLSTDSENHYNLSNGINFMLFLDPNSDYDFGKKFFNNGTFYNLKISAKTHYYYNFKLIVNEDGTYSITQGHSTYNSSQTDIFDISYQKSDVLNLLSAFYESNFYIDSTGVSPFGFHGIQFYGDSNIYIDSSYQYIGRNYFDNNLYFGAGTPLYPGRSYFTNTFDYGVPFTSDFSNVYVSYLSQCFFAPTSKFLNEYSPNSDNDNLNLYFKSLYPTYKDDFRGNIRSIVFYDSSYISHSSIKSLVDSGFAEITDLDVSLGLVSYLPNLLSQDSILYLKYESTVINSSYDSLAIYYNPLYWNLNCQANGAGDFTIKNYDGEDITINPNFVDDTDKSFKWYDLLEKVLSSIYDSIVFIGDLMSSLIDLFGRFLSYVWDAITDLLSLFSNFFGFIGAVITLFYLCMPPVVVSTLNIIFVISGLILIIKMFNM